MSTQACQGTQASGSAQGTSQQEDRCPNAQRPTPMPMDLTDQLLIYYNEGSPRPQPNPDRNCVIFRIDRRGREVFEQYIPRTRFPFGQGTIEQY